MTEAQKTAFVAWTGPASAKLGPIATFHRIRAQQLRKCAGVLEAFYKAQATPLVPTFLKEVWKPCATGHFLPVSRDDRLPAAKVAAIKDRFQEQLAPQDNAMFRMNFVRTQIEAHEDLAQEATDAPAVVASNLTDLNNLFNDPHYSAVLLKTGDTWAPPGWPDSAKLPLARVHPLDPPTWWELLNAGVVFPATQPVPPATT